MIRSQMWVLHQQTMNLAPLSLKTYLAMKVLKDSYVP